MTDDRQYENRRLEDWPGNGTGYEWIELFCAPDWITDPMNPVPVIVGNRSLAANVGSRVVISDGHAIYDADVIGRITGLSLPDMEPGDGWHCAADPFSRTKASGSSVHDTLKKAWDTKVHATVLDIEDVDIWHGRKIAFSEYRREQEKIGITGDYNTAVFIEPWKVDIARRIGLDTYQFDLEGRIHLVEHGTKTVVGLMPTMGTSNTNRDPFLTAIAATGH